MFKSTLISDYTSNPKNCLYGTLCPCCAIAQSKSNYDKSSVCFNICCFSFQPCIVRNYIRRGYQISGNHIDDFCISVCCIPFSATQLLNETEIRKDEMKIYGNKQYSPIELKNASICFDSISKNIDACMTYFTIQNEVYSFYMYISDYPYWASMFSCITLCQLHHVLRYEYSNVESHSCYDNCYHDVFIPIFCQYNTITNIRKYILQQEPIVLF